MSTSTHPRQYAYGEVLHKYMLTLYKACKKRATQEEWVYCFSFRDTITDH